MALGQASYTRDYGTPIAQENDGCYPRFHLEAEPIVVDGQTVYRDVEMVEVFMPGNPTTKPDYPVTDVERNRWPEQYRRFKEGLESPLDGTPLEEWAILRPAEIKMLKSFDFRTIEDIAAMSEHAIQRVGMGARVLKKKAEAFLDENAKASIVNAALANEEKYKRLYEDTQAQLARVNEQLAELSKQFLAANARRSYDDQNIATAGLPPVPEPGPMPAYRATPEPSFGAFARFAEAEVNEGRSAVESPSVPDPSVITVTPSAPRRGRPPKVRDEHGQVNQ